jgi:hypothetical protein
MSLDLNAVEDAEENALIRECLFKPAITGPLDPNSVSSVLGGFYNKHIDLIRCQNLRRQPAGA